MSREDAEVVKGATGRSSAQDVPAMQHPFHPDVVWHQSGRRRVG